MNSKEVKQVRGQIRQITKEILPEILTQQLEVELYRNLAEAMTARIKLIEENVKTTLEQIDQRSKDTLDYLVRQTTALPTAAPTTPDTGPEAIVSKSQLDSLEELQNS